MSLKLFTTHCDLAHLKNVSFYAIAETEKQALDLTLSKIKDVTYRNDVHKVIESGVRFTVYDEPIAFIKQGYAELLL